MYSQNSAASKFLHCVIYFFIEFTRDGSNMAHETTDPTCLTGAMSHLFDTGLFSDVAFLVGKEKHRFNVHRMILGGRSPVFATMLEERWAQQQTRTDSDFRDKVFIRFQEYDVESFRIFLKVELCMYLRCIFRVTVHSLAKSDKISSRRCLL